MTFFQKVKIILQVIFVCGLFLLNAAVYQKYNYFKPARHLSYIPKTTVLSITLNTNKLSGRVLYNFLYQNEKLMQLLAEAELNDKSGGDFFDNGLDLTSQLTVFMTNDSHNKNFRYAGLLCDIVSAQNAKAQLIKNGFKETKKKGFSLLQKNENQYAAVNDDVAILIHFKEDNNPKEDKDALLERLINGKESSAIGSKIEPYLAKGNEVVLYSLPENVSQAPVWIDYVVAYGNFKDDVFDFSADVKFKKDITSYFPESQTNPKFDFGNIDGYLYFKSTVHATNASALLDHLSFVHLNDSLQNIFRPVLHNQLCKGFEFYAHDLSKAELPLPENANQTMKLLSHDFFLPAFDFRLNCSDPKKIDTLLIALARQKRITFQKDNWYVWQKDKYYKIYMGLKNDWLTITTKPNAADQMPQTGFSNVIYFNTENFNSKLPNPVFRYAAGDYKYFESFLAYVEGTDKNNLKIKGKIVLKKEENSLIEGIHILIKLRKDIPELQGMFRSMFNPGI